MKTEFQQICQQNSDRIQSLEDEVRTLNKKIKKLEEKSDESEAYSRRNTIILSGNDLPAGSSTENCTQVVVDIVKSKLKVTINPSDISIAHSIGKNLANNSDRRKMFVKLCRRDLKSDLIQAVKTMKPSNFYISESLTSQNETIAYVLRRARKDFDQIISGSTTVDGINYVWVKPPNAQVPGAKNIRHKISTQSALSAFCSQTLHRPLAHYVPEWKH